MKYDLVVTGAGSAGAGAAAYAAGRFRVLLIDAGPADAGPRPDWTIRETFDQLEKLGMSPEGVACTRFAGITFHSPDLVRRAETRQPDRAGCRIDYTSLVQRLRFRAAEQGCACVAGGDVERLDVREDRVQVRLANGQQIEAGFLIRADGASSSASATTIACVSAPLARCVDDPQMHWVLGLEAGVLAAWWLDSDRIVLTMLGLPHHQAVDRTVKLLHAIRGRKLLPADIAIERMTTGVRPLPARSAMDLDSHVGKRSLTIGDAGGFITTITREGIYPGLWSARLAVDTVAQASASGAPQDALRHFSALWRSQMGAYLGIPSAQIEMLAPLVFTNPQMAARVATGFWTGESL